MLHVCLIYQPVEDDFVYVVLYVICVNQHVCVFVVINQSMAIRLCFAYQPEYVFVCLCEAVIVSFYCLSARIHLCC